MNTNVGNKVAKVKEDCKIANAIRGIVIKTYTEGTFDTVESFFHSVVDTVNNDSDIKACASLNGEYGIKLYRHNTGHDSIRGGGKPIGTFTLSSLGITNRRNFGKHFRGINMPEYTVGSWHSKPDTVYSWLDAAQRIDRAFKEMNKSGSIGECGDMVAHLARVVAKTVNPNINVTTYDFLVAHSLVLASVDVTRSPAMPVLINHQLSPIITTDASWNRVAHDYQKAWECLEHGRGTYRVVIVASVNSYLPGASHYYSKIRSSIRIPFTALCGNPETIVSEDMDRDNRRKWRFTNTGDIEAVRKAIEGSESFGPFYNEVTSRVKDILADKAGE